MPEADHDYAGLLAERVAQVQAQRSELVAAIEQVRLARSLTFTDDEHDPEGSLVSLDQAREAALLVRTEQTLAELAAARQRLASGAYGICEQCDDTIPAGRLQARPEARLCVPCSSGRSARR